MSTFRPTPVPHAARWAKRALSIGLLVVVLGSIAAPTPALAATGTLAYVGNGFSLPGGRLSRPMDGVGDSPIMP